MLLKQAISHARLTLHESTVPAKCCNCYTSTEWHIVLYRIRHGTFLPTTYALSNARGWKRNPKHSGRSTSSKGGTTETPVHRTSVVSARLLLLLRKVRPWHGVNRNTTALARVDHRTKTANQRAARLPNWSSSPFHSRLLCDNKASAAQVVYLLL